MSLLKYISTGCHGMDRNWLGSKWTVTDSYLPLHLAALHADLLTLFPRFCGHMCKGYRK